MEVVEWVATLLSKASHSDELVARINHTNLICDFKIRSLFFYNEVLENMGRTLIAGISDYLMRVVGSVPMGLDIAFTLELEDDEEESGDEEDDVDEEEGEVNSEEDDVELELGSEEVEAEGYAQS